jgi:fused signal recognition particle receptor
MFKFWKKKPADAKPETEERLTEAVPDGLATGSVPADLGAEVPATRESGIGNRESEAHQTAAVPDGLASNSAPAPLASEVPTDLGAAAEAGLEPGSTGTPAAPPISDSPFPISGAAIADSPFAIPGEAPRKRSWRERLSGSFLNRDIRTLFARNPQLDDALLDELETLLIRADVGVAASTELVEDLRRRMAKREFADADALLAALRGDLIALLTPVTQPLFIYAEEKPFVLLIVGVNGVGKTTTIGKLARRLQLQRQSVMLAAGDTFRAAAVEQLKTWGERNNVPVIAQGSGSDSASVIFDALQSARSRQVDVLIADTAGRLHTQSGLMDELAKIRRVLGKLDPKAPHEVLLVIDGTTGQNAISQTRQFRDAIGVTGLVVTKLDGTAKGGVVFALAKEFGLPIRFVGLGETLDDLREFDPTAFVDALLPANIGGAAA